MSTDSGAPLPGLRLPSGELTTGDRLPRTLRIRNAKVACAFDLTGKRVLDLGCAEGLHSLYMAGSAREVIGIDHRASVIATAEASRRALGIDNVHFIHGDIRDTSLAKNLGTFDLIVAWGLLHRITDIFSFLHTIAPLSPALSLEWRTPVFPFMSRLSLAYHSPVGESLDPLNLAARDQSGQSIYPDTDKIEGQTGFWEPTPCAVQIICKRLGYDTHRLLGYGERFNSEARIIRKLWRTQIKNILKGREILHRLPLSRVHMLFEKQPGTINISNPAGTDIRLPEWDHALQQKIAETLP